MTSKSDCCLVTSNAIALVAVREHDGRVCSMFEQFAPENRSFSRSEAPMSTLTQAHDELFRRRPDECFSSVESLIQHCRSEHRESQDRWHLPARLQPVVVDGELSFSAGDDGEFLLNDWSFSQICRLSSVAKETVNRLSPDTARAVLRETLPRGAKPMQLLTTGPSIRAIHSATYSRLWNSELLETVAECAG